MPKLGKHSWPPYCECGDHVARKELNGMCPICYNELCKISDPLLETKETGKMPTIQELNEKHERIVAEILKSHENDRELFVLERYNWKEEKRLYEMKLQEFEEKIRVSADNTLKLTDDHYAMKNHYEELIKILKKQLEKFESSPSDTEERKKINEKIKENEEQIKTLEMNKVEVPCETSCPATGRSKLGFQAPTALSTSRQVKKKTLKTTK